MPKYREIPTRSHNLGNGAGIAGKAARDGYEVLSEPGKRREDPWGPYEPYDPTDHPMKARFEPSLHREDDCG